MWSSNDICWMAGLFEGEGCISIVKNKRTDIPYVRVSLGMTDLDVIERLCRIAGLGAVEHRTMRPNRTKRMYYWRLNQRADIVRFLTAIAPLMGARRQEKIQEAVELIAQQLSPIICLGCGKQCTYSQNRKYCSRNCGRRYQSAVSRDGALRSI